MLLVGRGFLGGFRCRGTVVPASVAPVCIEQVRATGVAGRDEGAWGTSDPQLWVVDGSGGAVRTATEVLYNDLSPRWSSTLRFAPTSASSELCLEIRDDWPTDGPPLINSGCGAWDAGALGVEQAVRLDGDATVYVTVQQCSTQQILFTSTALNVTHGMCVAVPQTSLVSDWREGLTLDVSVFCRRGWVAAAQTRTNAHRLMVTRIPAFDRMPPLAPRMM
eukprot:3953454-Prymnesium_polylepis.1